MTRDAQHRHGARELQARTVGLSRLLRDGLGGRRHLDGRRLAGRRCRCWCRLKIADQALRRCGLDADVAEDPRGGATGACFLEDGAALFLERRDGRVDVAQLRRVVQGRPLLLKAVMHLQHGSGTVRVAARAPRQGGVIGRLLSDGVSRRDRGSLRRPAAGACDRRRLVGTQALGGGGGHTCLVTCIRKSSIAATAAVAGACWDLIISITPSILATSMSMPALASAWLRWGVACSMPPAWPAPLAPADPDAVSVRFSSRCAKLPGVPWRGRVSVGCCGLSLCDDLKAFRHELCH